MEELRDKVIAAQRAASLAEKEFLLKRGWEEQKTHDGVTWWYYEGLNSSEPQSTAVSYALHDMEKRFRS